MKTKNLKRQAIASTLLIFSSVLFTGISHAKEKTNFIQRFSIKISSGLSYWNVEHINKYLMSINGKHADYILYYDGLRKGELKKIGLGSNSEIELSFDILSSLRIYFGTGYVYAKKESMSGFEVALPEFYDVDFTFSPRISIRAIPLKLGASLIIPFSQKARMFINWGAEYYFARTNFYWKQREICMIEDGSVFTDITEMAEWDLSSKGTGYHGGIGFEYTIAKNLALVLEFQGRSAMIKRLKGTEIFLASGSSESFYGSVFYYEKKDPVTEKYYIGLGFYKEKPDYPYPEYRNIRNAELDLSGYSLKIGIKIRLF